jgi:magnesium chelatase family protein
VPGIDVVGLRSLRQLVAMLTDQPEPEDPPVPPLDEASFTRIDAVASLDVADVAGQEDARTAIVVAAAGGHHLAMTGPPGIGKTMLAKRLPGLLPDLTPAEALEVSAVHSVCGLLPPDAPLLDRPPFIDPHHTSSAVAIIGGGTRGIRPGAMSLAHRGVLFMDEAPEFASNVLDALRQPLESGHILIARANQTAIFPARFQLLLASNPCPCGQDGAAAGQCHCTPMMRRRYRERVTGPVRDRIDIHRSLTLPSRPELARAIGRSQTTRRLAEVVAEARGRQSTRLDGTPWRLNSEVPGSELRKQFPIEDAARAVLDSQVSSHKLSARAADRILGLAWSVADLRGHDRPTRDDALLALALRQGAPLAPDLRELVAAS